MISGTAVTVLRPTRDVDRLNNEVGGEPESEQVEDVLVVPGSTDEMGAERPDGITAAFTLHFPKSYTSSLEGCSVELPAPWGCTCRVVGDPQPYMDANTPTRWNRPVEVVVSHG